MQTPSTREDAFLLALMKGYDPDSRDAWAIKENWKRVSKAYFNSLAKDLQLDQFNVWFNAGGPAVSGDINLMGRKGERFFHLFGNLDVNFFTIRRAKGVEDWSGEGNRVLEDRDLRKEDLMAIIRRNYIGKLESIERI